MRVPDIRRLTIFPVFPGIVSFRSVVLTTAISKSYTRKVLSDLKLIDEDHLPIKVLGNGEWKRSLSFRVDKVSEGAKAKIEAVGGKVLSA